MLDDMVGHIDKVRGSLLARVYGIYTIRTNIFEDLDVIVMQNTAQLRNGNNFVYQFDLKGSTHGRYTPFNSSNILRPYI